MLFQFLCALRWTDIAPTSWHHSHAFSLPKNEQSNVEIAFDTQRTIRTLDVFGKSYYKHIVNTSGAKNKTTCYEYAYVKGRGRENAIKQQVTISFRLRNNKPGFLITFYDMGSAFGSVNLSL